MSTNINMNELLEFTKIGRMKRENPKEYKEMMRDIKSVIKDFYKMMEDVVNGN